MHRSDELDATLAKHFAWAFAPSEEAAAQILDRLRLADPPVGPGSGSEAPAAPAPRAAAISGRVGDLSGGRPGEDGGSTERSRVKAQATCRSLAAAIADAWAHRDDPTCLQTTKRLLARADRMGIDLLEMRQWPMEGARLLRLLVRFGGKFTRRQRERSASVATLIPLDHPEVSELLIEAARSGDRVVVEALLADDEWTPEPAHADVLVGALSKVVEVGPTHTCRAIAIELIARMGAGSAAVGALRRALVLPSFGVRARALHALATSQPCAVSLADLVPVLRDLVTHAVPDALSDDEHEENERIFAEAVIVALSHVRSEPVARGDAGQVSSYEGESGRSPGRGCSLDDAAEALLDWIDAEHDALWLDAGWATEALAVAFPETAAAMVDHWLKCARAHDRAKALGALERLPLQFARPGLLLAASDPVPSIRSRAREQWLRRFDGVCPADSQTLVGAKLLVEPPSERFLSRLVVMQGRLGDARNAMARALLAEAPDREALVLLMQLVGDDSVSNEPLATHLPTEGPPTVDWATLLVEKFGPLGVEALCALAERFPEPETFAWMHRLGDLVQRGVIGREQAPALRALASKHVASEDAGVVEDSVRLLALVGAPPELMDRALRLALDVDLASSAVRDLILAWPDRTIDARLASEMALALAEHEWARVQCAASVALERGAPAALVIAQRVLEIAESDEAATEAAVECAHKLRARGVLDDEWAIAALGRPESPIFVVAARVWRRSGAVRRALEDALTSTARHGVSRAEAAIALLWSDPPLSVRDRRLAAALAGAPPVERAELVHAMCLKGAQLSAVAAHIEELFVSTNGAVTGALIGIAGWLRSPKAQALLRSLLPRIVDVELRADVEEELGTPDTSYWVEG